MHPATRQCCMLHKLTINGCTHHLPTPDFFKGLRAFPMFMLKAQTVRLSNGETISDVTILLIDEGISIVSENSVRVIYHQSILEIKFTDPGAMHFMKGRNLAHWMRDVEETREVLEEFEYDFSEIESVIQQEMAVEAEEEGEESKNPYAE